MQSTPKPTPTKFINVFSEKGVIWSSSEVQTTLAAAVESAEEMSDQYVYEFTLTDVGQLDLTNEFSETWHERHDFDSMVDANIDSLKAERLAAGGR